MRTGYRWVASLLAGSTVASVGLVTFASTAQAAAVLPTLPDQRQAARFNFGEDTNTTTKQTTNEINNTSLGTPLTPAAVPGTAQTPITGKIDGVVDLVNDAGDVVTDPLLATGVNNDRAYYAVALPSAGRDYTDPGAFGFVATVTVSIGSTRTDSQNLFQKGVFMPADTNGQYKLQLKSNDDYPQCRFEENVAGGDAVIVSPASSNGVDVVGSGIWRISCWRYQGGAGFTDDVFGVSGENVGTGATFTGATGTGPNNEFTLGSVSSTPGAGDTDSVVGSLGNTLAPLRLGGKDDATNGVDTTGNPGTDTCITCKFYDFAMDINDPSIPTGNNGVTPLNADGDWTYSGYWEFNEGNGTGTCKPGVPDKAPSKNAGLTASNLDVCGSRAFRTGSSPDPSNFLQFRDGSYATTPSATKFNPAGVDFRVQARFRVNTLPSNNAPIVQKGSPATTNDYVRLSVNSTGILSCTYSDGVSPAVSATAPSALSTGQWYTAECIKWQDKVWLFVSPAGGSIDNNTPTAVAAAPTAGWTGISNTEALLIARRDAATATGNAFQLIGSIDRVRVYKGWS